MSYSLKLDKVTVRRISLFCIIMQSIGIRFFGGFGFLMIGVIILLNINNLRGMRLSHPSQLLLVTVVVLGIGLIKGLGIGSIFYIFAVILGAVLVLLDYNDSKANFITDITGVLWFFCVYGFISWSTLTLVPQIFHTVDLGLKYYTFLYFLFNNCTEGALPRLSSLLWEPGCSQFIFNFLLIILITQKESKKKILFVALLVFLTQSTTGYVNLIFILILYFRINKIGLIKVALCFSVIFFVGLYSIISDNITEKVANSSGIIRGRDLYVGYVLSKRHPFLGVDTNDLENNREAQVLEDEVWGGTSVWTASHGYFAGGYTNGLFGVLLDYGVIVGLILYWFTIKAPIIWNNRKLINPYCFFLVYFCSLIGEPISRTTLFFLFAFSCLINKKKALESEVREYSLYANS